MMAFAVEVRHYYENVDIDSIVWPRLDFFFSCVRVDVIVLFDSPEIWTIPLTLPTVFYIYVYV